MWETEDISKYAKPVEDSSQINYSINFTKTREFFKKFFFRRNEIIGFRRKRILGNDRHPSTLIFSFFLLFHLLNITYK